jgi:hypothetical protein
MTVADALAGEIQLALLGLFVSFVAARLIQQRVTR